MAQKKVSRSTPAPVDPNARLLNVHSAATYLGCTVWFLRTLTWKKVLPYLRLGHRLVYDRADLDAYIEKQKAVTRAA